MEDQASAKAELRRLYKEDLSERESHPAYGTEDYWLLRERDAKRRARAEELLVGCRGLPPEALYYAAWLFNHGDSIPEARRAHELAREAAKGGVRAARWLAAAAYDRWLMYQGKPQKYGTQFVPDGTRVRLWDTDPSTTDAERRKWDVPLIEEQLRRAEEMTRQEQQPDMKEAPQWLLDAIERWNREEGEGGEV